MYFRCTVCSNQVEVFVYANGYKKCRHRQRVDDIEEKQKVLCLQLPVKMSTSTDRLLIDIDE